MQNVRMLALYFENLRSIEFHGDDDVSDRMIEHSESSFQNVQLQIDTQPQY